MTARAGKRTGFYGGSSPTEVPAYTITEAAHYLRLPVSTVRAWTLGQRGFQAVIPMADRRGKLLSFENLVELHVLSAIRRRHQVKMSAVRKAVRFLERQICIAHPLARQQMMTDGKDLFVEQYGKLVNVSQSGQVSMRAILEDYLKRIEWDAHGIPVRLFPVIAGRIEAPPQIVIDPRVQFGRPCLRGKGIPTAIIAERFSAGESISELAGDYGVSDAKIQEALRCEFEARAA